MAYPVMRWETEGGAVLPDAEDAPESRLPETDAERRADAEDQSATVTAESDPA